MPTYSYACTVCDHRFDVVQSFADDSLTVCPECQGRLRKIFNSVGVVFKGSGFYRTDSRSAGKSTDSSSTSSNGKSGSGSKESKESSPAASTSSTKKAETTSTS